MNSPDGDAAACLHGKVDTSAKLLNSIRNNNLYPILDFVIIFHLGYYPIILTIHLLYSYHDLNM